MSAWLVDNDCINRILSGIETVTKDSYHYRDQIQSLMNVSFDERENLPDTWPKRLGQMMFEMNLTALSDRYGDTKPQDWRTEAHPDGYTYKYNAFPPNNTPIQQIKSFQCFLYQCSEGDVPESKLYKLLTELSTRLMARYIDRLPEYDSAKWG